MYIYVYISVGMTTGTKTTKMPTMPQTEKRVGRITSRTISELLTRDIVKRHVKSLIRVHGGWGETMMWEHLTVTRFLYTFQEHAGNRKLLEISETHRAFATKCLVKQHRINFF